MDNIARSTSSRRLEAMGVVLMVLHVWLVAQSQIGCSSAASRVTKKHVSELYVRNRARK